MPNAGRNEVVGVHGDALKVRLQALPMEGKANEALIRYLADILGVARKAVRLTHGHTNKRKMLEIAVPGLTVAQVVGRLYPDGAGEIVNA